MYMFTLISTFTLIEHTGIPTKRSPIIKSFDFKLLNIINLYFIRRYLFLLNTYLKMMKFVIMSCKYNDNLYSRN